MAKRYALVRVDEYPKLEYNGNIIEYGDTKEQLIRKIEFIQKWFIRNNKKKEILTYRDMAEKIVEFLGVEE